MTALRRLVRPLRARRWLWPLLGGALVAVVGTVATVLSGASTPLLVAVALLLLLVAALQVRESRRAAIRHRVLREQLRTPVEPSLVVDGRSGPDTEMILAMLRDLHGELAERRARSQLHHHRRAAERDAARESALLEQKRRAKGGDD